MTASASRSPFTGRVLDSALDAIGNTPMIRMDRIAKAYGLKCNLYGKVEYFNAGGSVKDRMALTMLEVAEKEGTLIPGKSVLVEPSAGNTGAALAMMARLKGYRCIIVMPARMSADKDILLHAFGAEVVRTPDPTVMTVTKHLVELIPNAVLLNQFTNPNNPLAHERTTAPEMIAAIESTIGGDRPTSGKIDVFCSAGATGGTLTGVARALRRDHNPELKVIACDPTGSILAQPDSLNDPSAPISLEGTGLKFVPESFDRSCVSHWIKVKDSDGYDATLEIHRYEALLVGGSSGAAIAGLMKYLKSEEGWKEVGGVEGKNVVVLLPDGIRNYMTQGWFTDSFADAADSPYASQINAALDAVKDQQLVPPIASLAIQGESPASVSEDAAL